MSFSRPGGPASSVDRIAASILEDLRAATPDVGDGALQLALDDVLDRFEDRLAALVAPRGSNEGHDTVDKDGTGDSDISGAER